MPPGSRCQVADPCNKVPQRPQNRPTPRGRSPGRASLDPPLQRRRPGRARGPPPRRTARHLYGRAGRHPHGHRAHSATNARPALRGLDTGPTGRVPTRDQGHHHDAQPHRRDPPPRRIALAQARDLVRRAGRPRVRRKKGKIETLYTAPPEGSLVVCLDEMGPVSAKTYPGRALTRPAPNRAKQEIDYGRRGKGHIFGAFVPATGAAFTQPAPGRGGAHWVAFLEQVEAWLPAAAERVYAIVDNLSTHRGTDVLLFMLAHPRWEMVFQPKYAAYLNLIEPWWKVLRSLALAGRRFQSWDEIREAVAQATDHWNARWHPFVWGHRRRHKPRRQPGIALLPAAA